MRTVKALRSVGVSMEQVRQVRDALLSANMSLASARLYWDGTDVSVQDSTGRFASALRHPGQQMLLVTGLPVGRWHKHYSQHAEPVDPKSMADAEDRLRAARRERAEPFEQLIRGWQGGGA